MVKKDSGGPDAGFNPLGLNTKVKLRAAPGASISAGGPESSWLAGVSAGHHLRAGKTACSR